MVKATEKTTEQAPPVEVGKDQLALGEGELDADRDPADVTRERFTDADADERGWLVCRVPEGFHRVPVARWAAYESRHGL